MPQPVMVSFVAGNAGTFAISSIRAVVGPGLKPAGRLEVIEGAKASRDEPVWCLRGATSNERYVERSERTQLVSRQESLGRPHSTNAALIPIRKADAWWEMTQDERRAVIEERSAHIATGLRYLPAIARRLHHSRDLGEDFDFLTWFEYSPIDSDAFEELVGLLRETEEWSYVEREVDIRLTR